jgi:cell division protein FtsX
MILVPVLAAMAAFTATRFWEDTSAAERHYRQMGRLLTVQLNLYEGDSGEPVDPATRTAALREEVVAVAGGEAVVAGAWQAGDWLVTDEEQPGGAGPRLVGTEVHEAPEGSPWSTRWVVDRGRLPRTGDEIFLTRDVAANGGWSVGDRVTSGITGHGFTVSGIGLAGDDQHLPASVVGPVDRSYWQDRSFDLTDVVLSPNPLRSGVHSSGYDADGPWYRTGSAQARHEVGVWVPEDRSEAVVDVIAPGVDGTNGYYYAEIPAEGAGVDGTAVDGVEVHGSSAEYTTLVSIGITVAMAGFAAIVAVVASAAFAIASRRQLKSVGLLATAGADPRTIRAALVLQGAIPGLAAGVLALAVTLVTVAVLNANDVALDRTAVYGATIALPVGRVLVAMGIGVVAGMLAAWQPARAASKIPVLSALAGRRPLGPVPTRVPLTGLAVAGAGAAGLAIVTRMMEDGRGGASATLVVLASVLAVVFGCIALAPTLVAVTGRLGTRLGGLSRLGLRSIARHRTQAAATVAALAVCLAIPLGGFTVHEATAAARNEARTAQDEEMPSETTVPGSAGEEPGGAGPEHSVLAHPEGMAVELWGDLRAPASAEVVDTVRQAAGPLTRIDVIGFADGRGGWFTVAAIDADAARDLLVPWAAHQLAGGGAVALSGAAGPLVLDDDLTTITIEAVGDPTGGAATLGLGIDADHLIPASVLTRVAVGRPPLSSVLIRPTPATVEEANAIEGVASPWQGDGYTVPTLAELEAARAGAPGSGTAGREPEPTSDPGIRVAGAEIIAGHPYTEPRYQDGSTTQDWSIEDQERRWLLLLAAATEAVALVVLAITLSLRSVDSAEDHRAAIAAGAPPARMRRQAAFEGVVLALLGAVLALPLGWLPVTAVLMGDNRNGWEDPGWFGFVSSRLHLPGWEAVPILLLPAVMVAVLWTTLPAARAALQRGPADQVLPRT